METGILRKALKKIPSRFELCVIAAERCKQLMEGATPKVKAEEGDPPTKLALMELAEGKVLKSEEQGKYYKLEPGENLAAAGEEPEETTDPEES